MKQFPAFLCSIALLPLFANGSDNSVVTLSPNLKHLSRCEKQVTDLYMTQFHPIRTAFDAASIGTVVSMFGVVFGTGSIAVGGSMSSAMGIVNVIALGGPSPCPGGAVGPASGFIISTVAGGPVVAAIYYGKTYQAYRSTVDRSESLIQFFKDIKNNGMGPQIEIRAAAIEGALQKVSFWDRIKGVPKNFNPATYSHENVIDALVKVGDELTTAETIDCSKLDSLSGKIDAEAMRILIEKFNPGLIVSESSDSDYYFKGLTGGALNF
jgi:hypothetical protein